jgi:hypothetical protein
MMNLKLLPEITGLTLAAVITSNAVLAQSVNNPTTRINVERKSGNCPKNIGLWWVVLPFEAGADHIAVADTREIANNAKVIRSSEKFVEYEAPLESKYASCVGQANLNMYSFQFRNRKLYFQVNLNNISGYRKIINKQVATGKPYVFWQAAQ